MADRNPVIDIARGLGILLVVLGHNWVLVPEDSELFRIVFSFHVPLFFFLSGIFLKDSASAATFAGSRAEGLLKPYVVVLSVVGIIRVLSGAKSWRVCLFGMAWGNGNTLVLPPLWFLPHLFLCLMFSSAILRLTKKMKWQTVAVSVLSAMMLAVGVKSIDSFWMNSLAAWPSLQALLPDQKGLPALPWGLDLLPVTSVFMLAGWMTREQVQNLRFAPWSFFFAVSAFAGLHAAFDETMNLNLRSYGNGVISTLQAITGIYSVLCISALIAQLPALGRIVGYIGTGSLFVLLFHGPIQRPTITLLSRFRLQGTVIGVVALVVAVAGSICLLEIVRRNQMLTRLLLPRNVLDARRRKFSES